MTKRIAVYYARSLAEAEAYVLERAGEAECRIRERRDKAGVWRYTVTAVYKTEEG